MTSCAANSISMITSYTPGITYPIHDDYLHSVTTCTPGATCLTHDDYLHTVTTYTTGITYPTCGDYLHSVTTCTPGATYQTHDDYLHSVTTCTPGATYPTHGEYLHFVKNGSGGTTINDSYSQKWVEKCIPADVASGTGGTTLIPAAWGSTFAIARVGTTDSTVLPFPLFQLSFRLFPQPAITRMSGVFSHACLEQVFPFTLFL